MKLLQDRLAHAIKSAPPGCPTNGNQLSIATGISRASFTLILDGTTKTIKFENAKKIAKALKVRPEWLQDGSLPIREGGKPDEALENTTADDDSNWTNVMGYAQAVGLGKSAEAQEYADIHKLKFKRSSLKKKGLIANNLKVFYGAGESMKEIHDGDAVMFDETDTVPRDDELYIIHVDGEYQCKKAMILDGVTYFYATNAEGAPAAWKRPRRMDNRRSPIIVVGRAWWIGRWLT